MALAVPTNLTPDQRRELLRLMLESRHGDLREESLNRQGKGHFHVSGRGHEAFAALGRQLQPADYVACYYRGRALCLARGMDTRHLALEYFAKRTSASRGRMMPSHFSSRELNIISVPTPLGTQLLPACGIAWSLQLDRKEGVVIATIGDAATRQGDFYEAVAFALERRLPMLFVVEDNAYGISTPTRSINPLALGVLNGAQWRQIDGTDAEAVHTATSAALAEIRAGSGPVFFWAKLERLSSHTSSDDHTLYRSKEDLAALEKSDPVRILRDRMIAAGELTAEAFTSMEAEMREQIRLLYAEAERAEDPRPDELLLDVTGPLPALHEELFPAGRYRMGDLINRTLRAGLDADPGRLIFGEDVEDPKGGVFRLTQKLSSDFPEQVFNSPLAESTIIGVGGGMALAGRRPVFELQFIDFSFPGFNQLVQNLANLRWRTNGEWKVPLVLYAPYGAYLPGGGLWHSQANEASFAHFPGINIVIPSTPEDAAGLLWTALHGEDITLYLAPKHMLWAEKETAVPVASVPFGRARVCYAGEDLTIVAWGNTVEKSQEAIAELKGEVSVELIDLRSIMPWDQVAIEASVRKTGRLIVVQEDTEACSVGQMIITHLMGVPEVWAAFKAPPVLISKGHVMIGYNPIYEYAALPDVPRLVDAIWRTVSLDIAPRVLPTSAAPLAAAPAPAAPVVHSAPSPAAAPGADIIVKVPIMGEGLRSARVASLNKKPGDPVRHDDVLCELETDKAVYPVEASFTGIFKAWNIKPDDTVLIGQEIAIVSAGAVPVPVAPAATPAATPEAAPKSVPAAPTVASRLVPPPAPAPLPRPAASPSTTGPMIRPPALPPAITKRLATVVPASMLMDVRWDALRRAREEAKVKHGKAAPSPSAMMAWCVTRAQEKHAGFRCLVNKDGVITEQPDFDQGVAVALEGDRLATAALPAANRLDWAGFTAAYARALEATRGGQVTEVQAPINITSLGAFGVESATPIVVPPAVATLFIGTAHERMVNEGGVVHPAEVVTLSLTFDHRVVNGAGAAAFLLEVRAQFESFRLPG